MYRNFWPRITLLFAVLFLVIGLVKPVYAIFITTLDPNNGVVDADWSLANPNPYVTDISGDQSADGPSGDILTGWVATDGGATTDYLYFRAEIRSTTTPINVTRIGVRIDCNGDGASYTPGDTTDRYVVYHSFSDTLDLRQVTPGAPPTLTTILAGPYPATDGEFIAGGATGNVEFRIQKSELLANGCANAATGAVQFAFVGIVSGGIHDFTVPELGPLWNTPTAVSLQTLTASATGTWLTVVSLALAALLFVTTIILRRRNQTAQ